MKKLMCVFIMCCALLYTGADVRGATTTLTYPDPGSPGMIQIASGMGDITVTAHDGNEVVITYDSEDEPVSEPSDDPRARGLKRLTGNSFRITRNEEANAILISRSMQDDTDLEIRVPRRTSVIIGDNGNTSLFGKIIGSTGVVVKSHDTDGQSNSDVVTLPSPTPFPVNFIGGGIIEGDIEISGLTGDVAVRAVEGDITITTLSGSVTASSVDGDIVAEIVRLPNDKPLSFSTVDGDVDVTLPASVKASLMLKSFDGEIYSNFNIEYSANNIEVSDDRVTMFGAFGGSRINGTINGGGRKVTLNSVDGNIYLRKGE